MLLHPTPRTSLNGLFLALCLALAVSSPAQSASGTTPEELRDALATLQADVAQLKAQGAAAERLAELERRIDLLAAEIEKQRTGGAAGSDEGALSGVKGLAPAASKVYGVARGVSLGGYGEALYERFADDTEAGLPAGRTDQFDFLRQIVYVGYKFNDSVLFNSEIEFEHASTGKGGEVSVEFAYIELQRSPKLGLRAGMLLAPLGFVNELHEPPIFHGAKRPEVESAVIPSTWRENGAGLFGEAGPVQWRAYVLAGLNSSGFGAAGIRGGRQSGARSKAEDFGVAARLDFTGVPGLLAGAAVFSGETGQGAAQDGREIGGRLTLYDLHAQYEHRGLQLRALYARGTLDDAALINRRNGLSGNKSVGEGQYGWYVQAAYDVLTLRPAGLWSLTPFVRYERLDTQDGVPAGYAEDPATRRSALTFGVGLKPLPNVVFKADWARQRNAARSGVSQFNLAVGYLF
jgi:tetrahydromethanopterin S-methyltransferase subunit G